MVAVDDLRHLSKGGACSRSGWKCSRWIKRNWCLTRTGIRWSLLCFRTTAQVGGIVSSPTQRWGGASYDPTTCTPLNTSMLLGMYSLAIIGAAISPTGRPGAYFAKDMETRISAIKSLSGADPWRRCRSGGRLRAPILGGSNFMPKCLVILRNF